MRRILLITLVLAAVAGGVAYWWFNRPKENGNELLLYGNIDHRQVQLAFNNNERIVKVHVEEGNRVSKGQPLAELDPDFREVLILRDLEDLSYEELSEITGLAEGTVKSRLHRARSMLKANVERKMGEKIR